MSAVERDPEQRIERLASEIGQIVRSVEPKRQEQLKELATTLVHEEVGPIGSSEHLTERAAARSMNPLAAGLGLLLLGAGLWFLLPPVGLVLALAGLIGIVWGVTMSWTKG